MLFVVLYLLEIILAFYIIYQSSGRKIFLYDIRFYFIFSQLLYGVSFPLFYSLGLNPCWPSFSALVTKNSVDYSVVMYLTATLGLMCGFLIMPVKISNIAEYKYVPFKRKKPAIFPLVALVLPLIFMTWRSSLVVFSSDLGMSRDQKLASINQYTWFYLRVLIISGFYFFIAYRDYFRRMFQLIIIPLFVLYAGFNLLLGNRRELLYLGFFFIIFSFLRSRKTLNLKFILVLFSVFIVFSAFGSLREINFSNPGKKLEVSLKQNEVVTNFQSLIYFVYNIKSTGLKLGESYLRSVLFIIPRAVWPNKPISLTNEFGSIHPQVSLSLIAEAFWNFGYVGPFIVFLAIGLILQQAFTLLRYKNHIYLYCIICVSLVINANRGDFASIFTEILVYSLLFILYRWLFAIEISVMTRRP